MMKKHKWKLKDGRELEVKKFECQCCHCVAKRLSYKDKPASIPTGWFIKENGKIFCENCCKTYSIQNYKGRGYGFRMKPTFYGTVRDRKFTEYIGLEQEFEGDFQLWRELEVAHGGQLRYGYDESVDGKNELSWDCGSYTWWKYLSNLKDVCKVLRRGGAMTGKSAGMHVHISKDGKGCDAHLKIASYLNLAMRGDNPLCKVVSALSERPFNQYCDPNLSADNHHACISFSRNNNTVEFRSFSASIDEKVILMRMLFCKDLVKLCAQKFAGDMLVASLSKNLRKWILKRYIEKFDSTTIDLLNGKVSPAAQVKEA